MEMRRKLMLFVCLTALSSLAYGQVAGVKTNVLMDITKTINLGTEIGLNRRSTLDLYFNYNPWKKNDYKMFKQFAFQPEYRYWFCERFNGHFVGVHAHAGVFQAAGIDLPFGLWDQLEDHRFKGHFYGAGVSYGYQWLLGRHWNLEANIGVGYVRAEYDKYKCVKCSDKLEEGGKNYFGPTKAAVSLIYLF